MHYDYSFSLNHFCHNLNLCEMLTSACLTTLNQPLRMSLSTKILIDSRMRDEVMNNN